MAKTLWRKIPDVCFSGKRNKKKNAKKISEKKTFLAIAPKSFKKIHKQFSKKLLKILQKYNYLIIFIIIVVICCDFS